MSLIERVGGNVGSNVTDTLGPRRNCLPGASPPFPTIPACVCCACHVTVGRFGQQIMAAPVTIFYTPLSQPARVVYWFCLMNKIPCKVSLARSPPTQLTVAADNYR
jgi:hypothetical protein